MDKKLFDSLVLSMEEMVAIEKGEITPQPEYVHLHVIPTSEKNEMIKDINIDD